jgi:transposase
MQLKLYGSPIFICRQPVDFRLGMDGLTQQVAGQLKKDPQKGIYLFYNRSCDKVKGLFWHKNGFILFCKRLERGRFHFSFNERTGALEMNQAEMGWLLAGLEWQKMGQWPELEFTAFS